MKTENALTWMEWIGLALLLGVGLPSLAVTVKNFVEYTAEQRMEIEQNIEELDQKVRSLQMEEVSK